MARFRYRDNLLIYAPDGAVTLNGTDLRWAVLHDEEVTRCRAAALLDIDGRVSAVSHTPLPWTVQIGPTRVESVTIVYEGQFLIAEEPTPLELLMGA